MLISPPFLVPRQDTDTDDAWINRCMVGGLPGAGAYPISQGLRWHGGMHLTAPTISGTQVQRVRAVADGTVAYVRPTGERPGNVENHAQNYGSGWTDNGLVILRHETEIGEGANARAVFYSIYMHLSEVHSAVALNRTVTRKTDLGQAGQIDGGTSRQIHFEIICDDANLRNLVGRAIGDLPLTSNGRADAIYGDIHFHLPVGTQVFAQRPTLNIAVPVVAAAYTITEELFVKLKYSGGEGAAGNRGDANFTTYLANGTSIGIALTSNDAEYDMYRNANTLARAFPEDSRPAASAVFELLRYGRLINTANETLTPANCPNWQEIRYTGGQGWVNLNSGNVHKFSDADFPHWQGWKLIDDTHDSDSRCNSPAIRGWLDANGDGSLTLAESLARAATDEVRAKLKRVVCKIPTEWNIATLDERWGWLKTQSADNPEPMSVTDFEYLRRHVAAMEFWAAANLGINAKHWHFEPREFVKQFRRSRWVTDGLLSRLYPNATQTIRDRYRLLLNRTMSKYSVTSSVNRMIHFIGQGAHESSQFSGMIEGGNTSGSRAPETNAWYNSQAETYFNMYDGRNGNVEPRDGTKFRGRGMKQLTGRYNYGYYWAYRNWIESSSFTEPWWNPTRLNRAPVVDNPQRAGNEPYTTIDAGAWYWEATPIRGLANGLGRRSSTVNTVIDGVAFSDELIRTISRTINGGEVGLPDRKVQTRRVNSILKDD